MPAWLVRSALKQKGLEKDISFQQEKVFADLNLIHFKSSCLGDAPVMWSSCGFPPAVPLYLETVKGLHPRVTISTDVTHAW